MAPRAARGPQPPARGQHFLRSRRLASEFVHTARIDRSDIVVDVGAGKGRITEVAAERARLVFAVERDPVLAGGLITRFEAHDQVSVINGDVLDLPAFAVAYRVIGNIPFGITTDLLRAILDDPSTAMSRADLIVQWGAAIKRARPRHGNVLNMCWGPYWSFTLVKRIPRTQFEPMPAVDAAVLSIKKRPSPLLPVEASKEFGIFVREGFRASKDAIHASLGEWIGRFWSESSRGRRRG